ncbi:MAG: hypothetical protein ACQJCO_02240 [cyanobacterium endosymbiont of Rhopalodia sterrenbergii]
MLTTTTEIINPRNYIIAATSVMFLSVGLTEVFKETTTVEKNICYNNERDMTAELIFYNQRFNR